VEPDQLADVFVTIIEVQRDHGHRDNRRRARMKYLVEEWGIDKFRQEVERRLGRQLAPPRALEWNHAGDHFGWHKQHDGKWYLGVYIENGRLQDANGVSMKTAFREVVEKYRPGIRLTSQQNILFTDVESRDRAGFEQILRGYGVPLAGDLPTVLLNSMACPAIPTCGLAVAESERALPSVVRRIHGVMAELGLGGEKLSVRMTGCPNGCARPYIGDIGLVGRTLGKYQVYVGGDFEGTRLNSLLADLVPTDEIHERLRPLFTLYRDERIDGEGFGDFCNRVGLERLKALSQLEPALV
jgi:sulfite reductase (ferredoxin)